MECVTNHLIKLRTRPIQCFRSQGCKQWNMLTAINIISFKLETLTSSPQYSSAATHACLIKVSSYTSKVSRLLSNNAKRFFMPFCTKKDQRYTQVRRNCSSSFSKPKTGRYFKCHLQDIQLFQIFWCCLPIVLKITLPHVDFGDRMI